MIKQIKRGALRTLQVTGAFRIVGESGWRQRRLLIVGYHGVSIEDEHLWDPAYYVTAEALDQRLAILQAGGYNVLPLAEGVERLASGTLPPRSVVLTFDDGLADFALKAHPLLQKYGFPATVYLSTYYTKYNRPVFGMFCSYVLWKARGRVVNAGDVLPGRTDTSWDLGTAEGRRAAHRAIVEHADMQQLDGAARDDLARRVTAALGLDYEDLARKRILRQVTPDEVASLTRAGVDFQLHTHRHRTPLVRELFVREIEENRAYLAQMTGYTADHFCYPSGIYHPPFLGWLRNQGVRSATTCDTGIATASADPLLLPRLMDTSNLELIEFESWVAGVGALLPRRPYRPAL